MPMVVVFLVSILAMASPSVFAVQHIVGDSSGWTNFGDYTTWADSKTFNVGDTLLFNYGGSHGVDIVSKSDYDNCVTSNSISSYSGGTTTINLTQPGPMYFACPSFGHCSSGMKLAINVVSKSTTTPTSGDNSSPPSSTTPSTPSTTSNPTHLAGPPSNANMVVVGISLILGPLFVFMC
ncbi:unnamed protein product [Lactuca saligna]|uniref:Phytocyanin domain-containing protein n=1 Tax=Lactuca saligna TaxID=75948 RepID=A0AA35ZI76_LACSI|nr:unnamed protein product [Lactuca saligna]